MLDGKDGAVDLGVGLHGVAAVDEDGGALGEHDRAARRAGEAGQPGQPFLARRQVFILLPVGAGYDKAVESAAREFLAQGRDPSRALGAFALVIEGLEMGFEHGPHSNRIAVTGNAGMREMVIVAVLRRVAGAGRPGNRPGILLRAGGASGNKTAPEIDFVQCNNSGRGGAR